MDITRYKQRREIHTKRHILDGISPSSRTASGIASRRPLKTISHAPPVKTDEVSIAPPATPQTHSGVESVASKAFVAADKSAIRNFLPRVVKAGLEPAPSENHVPPLDMSVPGSPSPWRQAATNVQSGGWRSMRRWSARAVAGLLIVAIGTGGVLFSQGYLKLQKTFKTSTVSAAGLKDGVDPNLLKGEGDGRINVLLLGRGGGDHEAPDLTDTMLLASIDPVNHTSTMISIPRDLWVSVPNQGSMKINAAWETGEFKYLHKIAPGSTDANAIKAGFDAADQAVEQVLGVTIHYNLMVNFQAFQQSVDTIGGITVAVPTDLVDPTMTRDNGGSAILAQAGKQTFTGKKALNYVRSRETTSDFARAERQRAVLTALKNKVTTLGTLSNPLKISGLLGALGNNVQTDLSLKDASRLYSITKSITDTKTTSVGLADPPNQYITTGTMAGQSVALPTAGLFNYSAIQTFARTQLKDPYILKEHAKVLVLNGTSQPELAANESELLKTYGYSVMPPGKTTVSDQTRTSVVALKKHAYKYTKHYLEQRYGVTAASQLPSGIQANGADFIVIMGSNETART